MRSGACMSFIHFRSKCLHFSGISEACRCFVAILPLPFCRLNSLVDVSVTTAGFGVHLQFGDDVFR